jgi:hypothetical protein
MMMMMKQVEYKVLVVASTHSLLLFILLFPAIHLTKPIHPTPLISFICSFVYVKHVEPQCPKAMICQ